MKAIGDGMAGYKMTRLEEKGEVFTLYRFSKKDFERINSLTTGMPVFKQNSRYVYVKVKGDRLNEK